MSIKATDWVFEHSESRGNDRLVLLVIAAESDETGMVYKLPIPVIARRAGLNEYETRRAIEHLESAESIHVDTLDRFLVLFGLGDW